ncbi:RNA-binding protein [Thermogymnomonas acidicola]|uniref:RNA-binding protein n=1 Tax=Thermogymnomonas acidicola TaxID=399579 RepID=A0AA37BQT3_9ARCH|nr:DUF1947 domain-containing protein [Thermogymnomonas acidicola]GGM71217.1 RNA-binding protein [Thermogymnomonas acidicola]
MSRHFVSKKEARMVSQKIRELGLQLSDGPTEVEEGRGVKVYFISGMPVLFSSGIEVPTLHLINRSRPQRSWIEVDDGAVPRISSGANLFAQGIVSMDTAIRKGDVVYIRDGKGTYVAVGIAERDGQEIMANKVGLAARVIHHVGDSIFKSYQRE